VTPLHVALVHRGQQYRYDRIDGQFAYPVPEFTWSHVEVHKSVQNLDVNAMADDFDLIWLDPGKYAHQNIFAPKRSRHKVPVIYWSLYPTLSASHRAKDIERGKLNANLVLVDHDDLRHWTGVGCPVRRLAYSVNERYYRDRGGARDIDVNFCNFPGYSYERRALANWLGSYCKRHGWKYVAGGGYGNDYAGLMARSKVMVHILRTPQTRPPRIFDTAASGTALLSNPMPVVSGESWEIGKHYKTFRTPFSEKIAPVKTPKQAKLGDVGCREIADGLDWLLEYDMWREIAANAKEYVLSCHTWQHRATELRQIVHEELAL